MPLRAIPQDLQRQLLHREMESCEEVSQGALRLMAQYEQQFNRWVSGQEMA